MKAVSTRRFLKRVQPRHVLYVWLQWWRRTRWYDKAGAAVVALFCLGWAVIVVLAASYGAPGFVWLWCASGVAMSVTTVLSWRSRRSYLVALDRQQRATRDAERAAAEQRGLLALMRRATSAYVRELNERRLGR